MEQFPLVKKDSGINRIVGVDPKDEKGILKFFKNNFENNELGINEKEKTPEQLTLLSRMNEEMAEFLQHYGLQALKVPPENIHILDTSKFTLEEVEKMQEKHKGFHSAFKQSIAVLRDYDENKLLFMNTLVHERLHLEVFDSYQKSTPKDGHFALHKGDEKTYLNIRRAGFSIGTKDGKDLYFRDIDEAIITELQIRYGKEYLQKWPELESETKAREDFVQYLARKDNLSIEEARERIAGVRVRGNETQGITFPYHDIRINFNQLIDQLYEQNKEEFSTKEEIFDLFAQGTLTGKLLPVARLIEKTFGEGSFRALGERTSMKSS